MRRRANRILCSQASLACELQPVQRAGPESWSVSCYPRPSPPTLATAHARHRTRSPSHTLAATHIFAIAHARRRARSPSHILAAALVSAARPCCTLNPTRCPAVLHPQFQRSPSHTLAATHTFAIAHARRRARSPSHILAAALVSAARPCCTLNPTRCPAVLHPQFHPRSDLS